jgi:hypothetical protein
LGMSLFSFISSVFNRAHGTLNMVIINFLKFVTSWLAFIDGLFAHA